MMNVKFLVNRVIYTLFMLLFIVTFNFFLFRLMPGDPLSMVARETLNTPEARQALLRQFGMDKPLYVQYLNYIKGLVTFNFGTSFAYGSPVLQLVGNKIVNSLVLAAVSFPLGVIIGLIGGIIAAAARGKTLDSVLTSTSMIIYAVPAFWLGMILLMLFSVRFKIFPVNGMVTAAVDFKSVGAYLQNLFMHLVLPVISYALTIFGYYFFIMRGAMIDAFTEDYVLTARAKGMRRGAVIRKHIFPNALLPVTTVVAINLALVITGSFSIEVLFSWPGMGRLMVDSVGARDYPVMQAINYLIALAVVLANFVMDILYSYLDPRVRIE